MTQEDFQLKWPQAEIDRIGNRVLHDYRAAIADHNRRMAKWREYMRRWLGSADLPDEGEEQASNVPVPYVKWNIFTKWAKEMDALFGDDAEIVAVPVGASDYRRDAKIGKYMTWRVFNSMKLTNPFSVFVLRKILFGRAVAYSPWKRDTFEVGGKEVVDYEGPDFCPLWPDDFIVPAEEVNSLHEFSFVVRRYRTTPDDLLKGERDGRYQGIKKNFQKIVNLAKHGIQRDFEGEEIKLEKDEAEGILYQRPLSSGEWVTVLEWYGKWRPLKKSARDGDEWDFSKREMETREFVVRYLPDLHMVIGVQDLAELYPTKKKRRPFVESSMVKDGRYWSEGFAQMLIDLEDELRTNHDQATEAGQLANSPVLGYRPASGFNPETFKVEPGMAIPLDNPATDLMQIKIQPNVEVAQWKEQCVLAYGEKLTGMSDLQMGRQSDRPNAPRTARQTVALLEEGNVRISLDSKVLREDMAEVLAHFWDLEYMFSPEQTFFRVTEEDADGLFEVNNGGSILTIEDRDGRYDFRLQFANSVYSREAKKEQALARYQLDLQNPLIAQNPVALWETTRAAHEALGDPNFDQLVPRPPAPDLSVDPKEEFVKLLHGEEIHVNPLDNDQLHLIRHYSDLQKAETDPNKDPDAIKKLVVHYHEHIAQLQQKKMQQAVLEQAAHYAAKLMQPGAGMAQPGGAPAQPGGGAPLQMPQGLFGGNITQPPGNPQAAGPFLYSGHPENLHGNS
ncbi:MAG: hypothetical protein JO345_21915 [Streptosporangiaceae bacterium]|nr:hypothetical protein [Streptosporangiaceae bacterium]